MWSLELSTITIPLELNMIYTLFIFQIIQLIFVNATSTMRQIFELNLNFPPKIGDVLIWQISRNCEPFTQLQYNGGNVELSSDETYLLLTQKTARRFTVYYRLGKNTNLMDKKEAAKYAVLLRKHIEVAHQLAYMWIIIARETEGMESDSFQHTINLFNKQAALRSPLNFYTHFLDTELPSPRPNLYVILGKGHSEIKNIPHALGIYWLKKKDICLVIEVEYKVIGMLPINCFCGTGANEKQMGRSIGLSLKFFGYTNFGEEFVHLIGNNKLSTDFKQFLEVLEDSSFYNPNEMDNSSDHLLDSQEFVTKREKEISLFNITNNGLEVNERRPLLKSLFQWYVMGFLLDTKSVAGVFLVRTNSKQISEMVKAIELAEEYLDETYPSSSGQIMRMRIVENYILDFEINLSDYPHVEGNVPDGIW